MFLAATVWKSVLLFVPVNHRINFMHKFCTARVLLVASSLSLACLLSMDWNSSQGRAAEDGGYGSLTGQYVLGGDVPPLGFLVKKGDPQAKDPAICAAADIPNEELVVDPESKGIANIFVYLPKATSIHPKLKESAVKEIVFDQKGCRFIPHVLFARTDQTVLVKSDDACAHNTHTYPISGQPVNFILPPNERKGTGIANKVPERLPFTVKCDIHAWMKAHWLVLDHPYAAITDEKGKFTIADLPAGDYEFRVWQEKVGYVNRTLKVSIAPGKVTDIGKVQVPADKFK